MARLSPEARAEAAPPVRESARGRSEAEDGVGPLFCWRCKGRRRRLAENNGRLAVARRRRLWPPRHSQGAKRRSSQEDAAMLDSWRTRRRSLRLGCEPDAIFRRHLRDDPRLDDVSRRFAKVDVEVLGDRSQDHQLDAGVVASLSEPLFRKRA